MCDFFIREERYAETMREAVEPYLAARAKDFSYAAPDGKYIYAVRYDADEPRGSVVIAHGFTESAEKYREMSYYFLKAGYSVVACDFRGHGRSFREVDPPRLTHIGKFTTYVDDLLALCDLVKAAMPAPYLLFAHSMGGAVSALCLERRPDFFAAAVLSSPMIAPARYGLPYALAAVVTGLPRLIGMAKKPTGKTSEVFDDGGFPAACGTSEARYLYYAQLRAQDERLQTLYPTFSWANEALRVTKKILRPGAPESIETPVLLFCADGETVVLPEEQEAFIARVPRGEMRRVKNSKHECYMSEDAVLFPYVEQVLSFYAEAVSGAAE